MTTASKRRRAGTGGDTPWLQGPLGWAALGAILATLLWNGGTPPLAWTLLCLVTLVLFAVQVALDVVNGLCRPARKSLWVAVPYVAVLVWLQVQLTPGFANGLEHPVWALAPDGAQPTISAAPDYGRKVVTRLTCYGLLFWIMMRSASAARNGGLAYVQAIALFSTGLAIYGVVSVAIGYNLLLGTEEHSGILRASLWNRNSYATVAVFGVLANITAYVNTVSDKARHKGLVALRDFFETFFSGAWVFAFGALVGLGALAMSLSRGGASAGLVGAVVLLLALRRGSGKINLAVLTVPVALVVFATFFLSGSVMERFDNTENGARIAIYGATLTGIGDRAMLGHGAGAYPQVFRSYVPMEFGYGDWEKAHNTYLENAFEFGVPAAVVLFVVLGMIGWRLLRGVRSRAHHQSTPAFALACLSAAAVHSLVDFSLQIPAIAALFAAILGIGWGQSFPRGRRNRG